MAKKKGGRPIIKYTKEMANTIKICGANVTKKHLASLLRIDVLTMEALFKREPRMKRDWELVNALTVDEIHNKHLELCRGGDVPSIRLFLQSKHPDYRPAAMVSVENTIQNKSTEVLYRPTIHRYDGSVDPETPEPDDVEAAGDELEEIWDTNEDEPKSPREVMMEAASREMEQASSKTEDLAAIFL